MLSSSHGSKTNNLKYNGVIGYMHIVQSSAMLPLQNEVTVIRLKYINDRFLPFGEFIFLKRGYRINFLEQIMLLNFSWTSKLQKQKIKE